MPCNILFTTSCEWFHPNIRIWNQWGFWLCTIKTLSRGSFLLLPSEISVKQGLNVIKMNALLRSYFFSQYSAFISSLKDEEKTVSISISRGSKVLWVISDVWVVWGISRHLTIWFIHSIQQIVYPGQGHGGSGAHTGRRKYSLDGIPVKCRAPFTHIENVTSGQSTLLL